MEYPMEESKTSSTIPSCLRRTRQCSRFRSTRGSRTSAKYLRGFSISPCRLSTSPWHIAIYMRRPWGSRCSLVVANRMRFRRGTVIEGLVIVSCEAADQRLPLYIQIAREQTRLFSQHSALLIRRDCLLLRPDGIWDVRSSGFTGSTRVSLGMHHNKYAFAEAL